MEKFQIFKNLNFDGYVVATATDSHIGLLADLIPLGKPILCEKPISLTVEDTDSVIEDCKKYGTQIQVGFQRRFDPPIGKAAKMVAGGEVGTLYAMHMYAHDHLPSTLEFLEGSGSIYRDLHVHDFDLIRWVTQSEIVQGLCHPSSSRTSSNMQSMTMLMFHSSH